MATRNIPSQHQHGVVLLITLIMLVAMTLGGIALVRSVHVTTMIAGNLSFQQATLMSASQGQETAIRWLIANSENGGLDNNQLTQGYSASRRIPPNGMSWGVFWDSTLQTSGVVSVGEDSIGNRIEYVIDRLCQNPGAPNAGAKCAKSNLNNNGATNTSGQSKEANKAKPSTADAVYYRILTRVQGPRSTTSIVETIVMF